MGTTVVPRPGKWERSRCDQHQGRGARRGDVHGDGLARAARAPGRLRRDPRAGAGVGHAARLRALPERRRPRQRADPHGRGDRAAGDPVVLRRDRPGRRGGAARARLRPAALQPRRRRLRPAPGLRDQPADQARRRRPGAQPQAEPRRAGAALARSVGRSRSSAPTCPAGRRSASTTTRPPRPRPGTCSTSGTSGSPTSAARPRACSTSPHPSARLAGYRRTLRAGRAAAAPRASRRTASSPSPAACARAGTLLGAAGPADRDLRRLRRDGDRRPPRRPRARTCGCPRTSR